MRRYPKANLLLFLSFLFLLMALGALYVTDTKEMKIFYFLMQSCFIGAFADWFAVEALFRNRLHLPGFRPVILANRERIIRTLRGAVNDTLLPHESIRQGIERISLFSLLQAWGKEGNKEVADQWASFVVNSLSELVERHEDAITRKIQGEGERLLSRGGHQVERLLLSGKYNEKLLYFIVEEAKQKILSDEIHHRLSTYLEEMGDGADRGFFGQIFYSLAKTDVLNIINYDDMATAVQDGMWKKLDEWQDETSPFHQVILCEWNELLHRFLETEEVKGAVVHFLTACYEAAPTEEKIRDTLHGFVTAWGPHTEGADMLARWMKIWWNEVVRNNDIQEKVDHAGRLFLRALWQAGEGDLYKGISNHLETLSAEGLTEFIESRVHRELEGIRINGALVGAVTGVLLYRFIEYFYIPIALYLISS